MRITYTRRSSQPVAPDPELEALAAAAREGDAQKEAALTGLYSALWQKVYRDVQRYVRDPEAVAEVTQEVWVKVVRSIGNYRLSSDGGVTSWVMSIARNTAIDWSRARGRRMWEVPCADMIAVDTPAAQPGPEQVAEQNEMAEAVVREVGRMRRIDREILTLIDYVGVNAAEAADLLGISHATARARHARARAKLRAAVPQESRIAEYRFALATVDANPVPVGGQG
ncbi:RNA polymerase sigma factor [Actinacidiphila sp. bgisy160]|uniref:RNA polymerase sigma factor n=1 Tax=Actinacidiphila sp. bgisy160 TaxID=3413796 RepID=UPI003D736C9C